MSSNKTALERFEVRDQFWYYELWRGFKMPFTKSHYETIARVLHGVQPVQENDERSTFEDQHAQWERTCLAFLNHFRQDNPAFDADRFLAACKGEKNTRSKRK